MKYQANQVSHCVPSAGFKTPQTIFVLPVSTRTQDQCCSQWCRVTEDKALYFSHFLPFSAPLESVALLPRLPSIILSSSLSMIIIPHACYIVFRSPQETPLLLPHAVLLPSCFVISDVHPFQTSASSLGQFSLNALLVSLPSFVQNRTRSILRSALKLWN